jgi:hypothetical protein
LIVHNIDGGAGLIPFKESDTVEIPFSGRIREKEKNVVSFVGKTGTGKVFYTERVNGYRWWHGTAGRVKVVMNLDMQGIGGPRLPGKKVVQIMTGSPFQKIPGVSLVIFGIYRGISYHRDRGGVIEICGPGDPDKVGLRQIGDPALYYDNGIGRVQRDIDYLLTGSE